MYQYQIRADEGSVIEKGTYCYNYYMLIITHWYYDTEKNTEKSMHCLCIINSKILAITEL